MLVANSENEGRVEVCFDQRWGTINGDGWTHTDTQVACRQLGYSTSGIQNLPTPSKPKAKAAPKKSAVTAAVYPKKYTSSRYGQPVQPHHLPSFMAIFNSQWTNLYMKALMIENCASCLISLSTTSSFNIPVVYSQRCFNKYICGVYTVTHFDKCMDREKAIHNYDVLIIAYITRN